MIFAVSSQTCPIAFPERHALLHPAVQVDFSVITSQNVGLGKSAALNRIGIGNGSADHRHSWSTACNTASITLKKTWLGNTCCAEWCCESWRVKICGQESRQQASEKCFGQMWSIGKSPGTSQEGFRWTAINESWGAGKANRRCMVGDILLVKAV